MDLFIEDNLSWKTVFLAGVVFKAGVKLAELMVHNYELASDLKN